MSINKLAGAILPDQTIALDNDERGGLSSESPGALSFGMVQKDIPIPLAWLGPHSVIHNAFAYSTWWLLLTLKTEPRLEFVSIKFTE